MARFELVFLEHRYNDEDGEPHVDGRLLVDRKMYVIRGIEWLVEPKAPGGTPRFVCTVLADPTDL
jgi:hypothetical protein